MRVARGRPIQCVPLNGPATGCVEPWNLSSVRSIGAVTFRGPSDPDFVKDLTTGSIPRHLVSMAVPMAAGMIFQTLYYLVDL